MSAMVASIAAPNRANPARSGWDFIDPLISVNDPACVDHAEQAIGSILKPQQPLSQLVDQPTGNVSVPIFGYAFSHQGRIHPGARVVETKYAAQEARAMSRGQVIVVAVGDHPDVRVFRERLSEVNQLGVGQLDQRQPAVDALQVQAGLRWCAYAEGLSAEQIVHVVAPDNVVAAA